VNVPESYLLERLVGRRVCKKCGEEFHIVSKQPKANGVCDKCGGSLIQRDDDQEATIHQRFAVYLEKTVPLIDYYTRKGLLRKVDGTGDFDAVTARVNAVVAGG
jgi:adenylate kinase